jgi:class 3 adenylate cyclase/tetratricopeptide (TPR) repeat protein
LHPAGASETTADTVLDSFLPADRREALISGTELPLRRFGAALFVDISGSRDLTDRLVAEHGPRRGAELLSETLSELFGALIDVVHRHRGSVVGFAGDGFTCWFSGRDGVGGAMAAALECRATARMPIKVVVTAGYGHRFVVGDPGLQLLEVLAGALVDRLGIAEKLAETGEVLVGGELLGWLGDGVQFEWRRDELKLPRRAVSGGEAFAVIHRQARKPAPPTTGWPPAGIDPPIARKWVPASVYDRMARGEGSFVSELRNVATLFLRFGGIDFETDERAVQKLDRFIRRVQRTVVALGGDLLAIIVGDKGSYLYAAFGAQTSHEDDPQRATRAAVELIEGQATADVTDLAAGISQGIMLCGIYGATQRRTYGAVGKPANEAARLMEAAPTGTVLVAESVASSLGRSYATRSLESPVAGITAYEVTGVGRLRREPSESLERLVGREAELAILQGWLDEADAGRGRIAAIVGEPGIGKSRLLAEFEVLARNPTRLVGTGSCSSLDATTPYFVLREVFAQLLALPDEVTEEQVRTGLQPLVGADADLGDLLPLLNPVLPVVLPATARTAELSREGRNDLTQEMVLRCLEHLNPSVLIIDDGQWMDSASRNLIELAGKNLGSLLVVVATRPSAEAGVTGTGAAVPDLPEHLDRLVVAENVLWLGPLAEDEVVEVASLRLGVRTLPLEVASVLALRSGGNPFFVEELARALADDGLIAISDGRAVLQGSLEELRQRVPETIIMRIQARLSALARPLQTTVTVASLLGQEFSPDLLAEVHPTVADRAELERELDELVATGLLVPVAGEPLYRFGHALIREAAEGLPVTETARSIHAGAAGWIEHNHPDLAGWQMILAQHWDQAGESGRAIGYWATAAEEALDNGAYDEAVRGFQRALELHSGNRLLATSLEAARWHMLLGEARVFQQGQDERQAREDLIRGLELIGEAPPRFLPQVATVGRLLEQVRNRVIGRRPVSDPAQIQRYRLAARAYEQLVEVYFLANDDFRSLHASFRTLNLAELGGDSADLARGYATVGALVGLIPRPELADRYLDRAEAAASATDDLRAQMWVGLVRGFYYAGIGRWETAEAASQRGRDLALQIGDRRRLEDGLAALMVEAWFQGRMQEAVTLAGEIHALASRRHARRSQAYAAQGLAYAYVDMGASDRAGDAIDELEDLGYRVDSSDRKEARRPDDEALASDTLGLRSLICLRSGRVDDALADARLILKRVEGTRPFNFSAYKAYNAGAEVLVMAGDQGSNPATEKEVARAVKLAESYAKIFPIGRPRPPLWQGILEARSGQMAKAVSLLRTSANIARSMGLATDEARALYELVKLGEDEPKRADELIDATGALGVARAHGFHLA